MKMSVFRQGQVPEQHDHLDLMKVAVGKDAINMILHARLHKSTVLVGLEVGQAVLKFHEETDADLRFEDLFDTAITLHDFEKMQQQNVRTREELAPHLYEMEVLMVPDRPVSIRLRIKADNDRDLQTNYIASFAKIQISDRDVCPVCRP